MYLGQVYRVSVVELGCRVEEGILLKYQEEVGQDSLLSVYHTCVATCQQRIVVEQIIIN